QNMGTDPAAVAQQSDTIFNEAYNDLVQGNTDLAIQGFTAFVTNYPKSERADDAQYYIGEAYYNDGKIPQAIAAFTRVLNDFPNDDRSASALYKRALAEKQINEKENAVNDFRMVIQRFPAANEAALAQGELEALGVSVPTKSAPRRKQ